MKKLIVTGTAAMLFAAALAGNVQAAAPADTWEDTPAGIVYPAEPVSERVTILISGGESPSAFYGETVNGTTYAPVREFSIALGATSVVRADNAVSVSAPGLELEASAGNVYISANGRYLFVPGTCIMINDSVYAPVRVLAEAFGANVEWSSELKTARITPGTGPISSEAPYSDEDLLWMARIITAEARGECFEGMLAVGNVIMNRIEDDYYPDTVYGVVFDGIQFTPAFTGAIYNTPTEECTIAAKLALEGAEVVGDSRYFSATQRCWAAYNREYYGVIGGHYFYI